MSRRQIATIAAAALAAAGLAAWLTMNGTMPQPGSLSYEEVTRAFYRGLASLQVGLLDSAREEFGRATELEPREPASWANLGITLLRLGELDAAVAPIQRAASLAPGSAEVALLVGRMNVAGGRLDEGVAAFRRAVELDPRSLPARFALAEEIERAGGTNADQEAQAALDALLERAPDNLAVLIERTRLSAKRSDLDRLRDSAARLGSLAGTWPPAVTAQYQALQQAVARSNVPEAQRSATFLRNVLARVPAFQESLAAVRTPSEEIAEPFDRFLTLAPASPAPAPRDNALSYTSEPLDTAQPTPAGPVLVVPAGGGDTALVPAAGQLAIDWNNDFRTDVLVTTPAGVRLVLQGEDGSFREAAAPLAGVASGDLFASWAADVEMDGDIDVLLGMNGRPPLVLRNNGTGTATGVELFAGVTGARAFAWADADGDGDPDAAFVDAMGALHVFANRQAGLFQSVEPPGARGTLIALAAGDVNADGVFDLVTLSAAGQIDRWSMGVSGWVSDTLATWAGLSQSAAPGSHRLFLADLDNNGALDVVASGAGRTGVWLAGDDGSYTALARPVAAEILAVLDLTGDGLLDLAGVTAGQSVLMRAAGSANYHWQVIRPRAQQLAGDQRINSFGIGGEIEVRSGLLTQKQILTGTPAHFGLGTRTSVDVARIVWPNGVMQAEFDPAVDAPLVAQQRLKGSCPWVFAYDGSRMTFVTDFLWRSPLGLRINAQDTAGIAQTEDWVRIRGDQLAARGGVYDVRITAELWETHFIDHVALLVVDHPADADVFVDERFANEPPVLEPRVTGKPTSVARAWDHRGSDVTPLVRQRDGRHLGTFERAAYQGIAEEHFVEVELGDTIAANSPKWLVAQGWIYPTDSSINVAIGQGGHVGPKGLSLDAQDRTGRWVVVSPDLGFPAGKNKTILVDLHSVLRAGLTGVRRVRLRTNLEIYWDFLGTAAARGTSAVRIARVAAHNAELRFRGFSQTDYARRDVPETPDYERLASIAQRWRDLVGYHTRFGDVRELVDGVDDRYVIMNAGDELRLRFPAPPPSAGWTRDFVLIGDGWEKDGDFNTGASQTVLPLPSHDRPEYNTTPSELEDDPVYRRHSEDWQRYHTRYVTPRVYLDGLRTR